MRPSRSSNPLAVFMSHSIPPPTPTHHPSTLHPPQVDLLAERKGLEEEAESLKAELAALRSAREAEKPEVASLEADIAGLTVARDRLASKGEGLRAQGNEAKAATQALIDDIVRVGWGGWVRASDRGSFHATAHFCAAARATAG